MSFDDGTPACLQARGFYALAPGLQFLAVLVGAVQASRTAWILALLSVAGLATVGWWQALARKRLIGDIPTSKIASAAQGYVELQGTGAKSAGTTRKCGNRPTAMSCGSRRTAAAT